MKRILIVEDENFYQKHYSRKLDGKVEIVAIRTLQNAEEVFQQNSPFDLIVMDACIDSRYPDSYKLTEKIRESFTGPMIAASSAFEYRQELMELGCTHESVKAAVPNLVLEILGLE